MTLGPGTTLGRYQIVDRLGQGGMATVYKAYQPALERTVALKVIRRGFAEDPEFRERFAREAKAIARLQHPSIVQVFDFDEVAGEIFLAMQYLEGGTLKDRLATLAGRGQRLEQEEAAGIVRQVASALEYAHGRGVIHRDIKPSNVMLSDAGAAVVTDFGIAKIVGGTQHTATGVGIGTPEYMSPEQGQGHSLDGRTDQYALGIVAYEMLTGTLPYSADTPFAVVLKHVRDPLPLPSKSDPSISTRTEQVLLRALAKDPADRYGSVSEFATELERSIEERPGRTLPTLFTPRAKEAAAAAPAPLLASGRSLISRLPRHLSRPLALGAAAAALLLLGGGGAAVLGAFGRAPEPTATPVAVVLGATPTPTASAPPLTPTPTGQPTPTATPSAVVTPTASATARPTPTRTAAQVAATPAIPVRIAISPPEPRVLEGRSIQLTAAALDANGVSLPGAFTWSVVSDGVHCVGCGDLTSTGRFTATTSPPLQYQTVRVRATSGSLASDVTLIIYNFADIRVEPTIPLARDHLDAVLVDVGQRVQFVATVLDQGGVPMTDLPVTWSVAPKSAWCGWPDDLAKCGDVTSSGLFTALGKFPELYWVGDKTQVCATTSNPQARVPDYSITRCVPIKIR